MQWIASISGERPRNDKYLVTLRSGRVTVAGYLADDKAAFWYKPEGETDIFLERDPVIAWMPLPEAYGRR